jgi:23S rRNA (uracil1939-C5)-methyltransferase
MARRTDHGVFETPISALGRGGVGLGVAPDGKPLTVKPAAPGSRLLVRIIGREKGGYQARRFGVVEPPPNAAVPRCGVFGSCGGCQLQELGLEAQRRHKVDWALREVAEAYGDLEGVTIHPVRGDDRAYGYRNKVEVSFGTRRERSEAEVEAGVSPMGRFLGFHAPGRFDRLVDAPKCELVGPDVHRILEKVREMALDPEAPPPWDVKDHSGFWRYVVLRRSELTGEVLVGLFTAEPDPQSEAAVGALASALIALPLEFGKVAGVQWRASSGVADTAHGALKGEWGSSRIVEAIGKIRLELSLESFLQTNTPVAAILYDAVSEALVGEGGTLVDLYCGTGAIGLYLADRFAEVVGVESVPEAVADAVRNAALNGVQARYVAAKVEEALDQLPAEGRRWVVVDPPRVGLHPKVAQALGKAPADGLVYVACHPASLGRDAAALRLAGWRLDALWPVDLFPQTGHLEIVGRMVRSEA